MIVIFTLWALIFRVALPLRKPVTLCSFRARAWLMAKGDENTLRSYGQFLCFTKKKPES